MLSHADNALLTETGPETPMGALLREYWMPALRSGAVEAGGAPCRVRLLGENLVVFRTEDGEVGALDEACPHRGASLTLARNEDCALRCIYHGWKLGIDGRVLETPNEGDRRIGPALHMRTHLVEEAAGIIWVRFAPTGSAPPLPRFEFFDLPPTSVRVNCLTVECNWLQVIEGEWDPTHLPFMHRLLGGPDGHIFEGDASGASFVAQQLGSAPSLEFERTDYGFRYAQIEASPSRLTRVIVCALPWWVSIPTGPTEHNTRSFLGHVPIDDRHTRWWFVSFNTDGSPVGPSPPPSSQGPRTLGDWSIPGEATHWGQDRLAMAAGLSYTGIDDGRGPAGGVAEDVAVCESMGPIVDRTREHLGASDLVISRARRLLLEVVDIHCGGGAAPWLDAPLSKIRSQWFDVPEGEDWRTIADALSDSLAREPTVG